LEAEVESSKGLVQRNDALSHELEAAMQLNEDTVARQQAIATQVQEQKHQIALLNQERQKASEAAKELITKLQEKVTIVNDRILVIERKGAEKLAAEKKKVVEKQDKIIEELESTLKTLEEEYEADVAKYLEEYKINTTTIDQLKEKDVQDVEKEQKKAAGELKKLTNAHDHAIKRLRANLAKLQNDVSTGARLSMTLRDQKEFEKKEASGLEGRASGLKGTLLTEQEKRSTLEEKLKGFEQELQRERELSAQQLEAVRNEIIKTSERENYVIISSFENDAKRISEELALQTKAATESARRLVDTRRELESQIIALINDNKEFAGRKLTAEEQAKKADLELDTAQTLARTTKLEVSNWEQLLNEEKQRFVAAEKKLKAEEQKTKAAADLDHDKIAEQESELRSSTVLIETLRQEVATEESTRKGIEEERQRYTQETTAQIAALQEELAKVRAETEQNRNTASRFEAEIRKSQTTNSHLKTRVDAQNAATQKDVTETKEVHNVEVQVVERK